MSDEFKVQWSVSLPPAAQYAKGDMLNIRGASVEEVEGLFDEALSGEFIEKASNVANLLRAAQVVVEGTAPTTSSASATTTQSQPAGTGRVCDHGKMEFKEAFVSRAGKKISASWNCPLGYKNPSACKTQWADD